MRILDKIIFKMTTIETSEPDILFHHFEYIGRRAYVLENGEKISGKIVHGFMGQDDDVYFVDDNGKRHHNKKIYVLKK